MQIELSLVTVVLQIAIGLGLALLLDKPSRLLESGPHRLSDSDGVAADRRGDHLEDASTRPMISPLHRLAAALGMPFHSLITNAARALWAIAAADTWEWFPFTMLMMLAALQMVPKEPIEAARIDGAGPLQLFWYVRCPIFAAALVVAALFRLIDSIKAFPLIYVLTDGGPGGATEVTNYYAFVQTFNFAYWGYGSAIAMLMVAGVFLLSLVISRAGGAMALDE